MFAYPFPMCSATATVLPIDPIAKEILLVRRAPHVAVHPGKWSLIGGFMNTKVMLPDGEYLRRGENLRQCASREAEEETGMWIEPTDLVLFDECSDPGTDPRAHVVNACYYVTQDGHETTKSNFLREDLAPHDDVSELRWVNADQFAMGDDYANMAFNHREIALKGILCHRFIGRAVQLIERYGLQD
jgi:ADP-ribose pyrophosphatase YjhB (NUDIX family)